MDVLILKGLNLGYQQKTVVCLPVLIIKGVTESFKGLVEHTFCLSSVSLIQMAALVEVCLMDIATEQINQSRYDSRSLQLDEKFQLTELGQ